MKPQNLLARHEADVQSALSEAAVSLGQLTKVEELSSERRELMVAINKAILSMQMLTQGNLPETYKQRLLESGLRDLLAMVDLKTVPNSDEEFAAQQEGARGWSNRHTDDPKGDTP